jgi:hypothetical protein
MAISIDYSEKAFQIQYPKLIMLGYDVYILEVSNVQVLPGGDSG